MSNNINQNKNKSAAKAIFFFLLAALSIGAIFYSYYHTVVPAKEECDKVAEETRDWNREHAGEPGMYVRPPSC